MMKSKTLHFLLEEDLLDLLPPEIPQKDEEDYADAFQEYFEEALPLPMGCGSPFIVKTSSYVDFVAQTYGEETMLKVKGALPAPTPPFVIAGVSIDEL